jgi:D-sedoheptulose 7-phosphate isomerase
MGDNPFLKSLFNESSDPKSYFEGYMKRISQLALMADNAALQSAFEAIELAVSERKAIYLMGNGGSSSAASHIVNDLSPNSLVEGAPGIKAFNLSDNVASLTATANDSGFDDIFATQLAAYLEAGDLVIGFSVSGNSPNIVKGAQYAKQSGAKVIGLTGFGGGKLGELSDVHVNFPSSNDEYGPVEDMFSIAGHAISGYLTMRRGRWLHH